MAASHERWSIEYRHALGERGKAWLAAAGTGRAVGFRNAATGKVTLPPTAPVGKDETLGEAVPVGPGGAIVAIVKPRTRGEAVDTVAAIHLDHADEAVIGRITETDGRPLVGSCEIGDRVVVRPVSTPATSAADLTFVLA